MGFFRSSRGKNGAEQDHEPLTNEGSPRPPKDSFNLAYISYFILGTGFLLPWNAYITAVDYFSYIYPGKQVDRVFSVGYMVPCLAFLLVLLKWAPRSNARVRINLGLSLFFLCLVIVPVMDAAYIKGHRGLDAGYFVTVAAVVVCGVADALVQGSLIGSAGELPEEYMQAVVAGTAASGTQIGFSNFYMAARYKTSLHWDGYPRLPHLVSEQGTTLGLREQRSKVPHLHKVGREQEKLLTAVEEDKRRGFVLGDDMSNTEEETQEANEGEMEGICQNLGI
ncbi:hypothetical protein KI387_001099 [Taxus chinensis]|uniref:Equilibrative nucleoside transporter n=1 Tax=Taxus chinensis TaxID=29808 RepID=A0AA38GV81_TAXCH|nr:hypothetical protein KI387_001099 [Taxus chinensis]